MTSVLELNQRPKFIKSLDNFKELQKILPTIKSSGKNKELAEISSYLTKEQSTSGYENLKELLKDDKIKGCIDSRPCRENS